jgi:hypothetical protein
MMYGPKRPSRLLNDSRFVLGLNAVDFSASVGVFVMSAQFLNETPYAILSIIFAALFCAAMIPIRMKHRDRICRDTLLLILTRGRF